MRTVGLLTTLVLLAGCGADARTIGDTTPPPLPLNDSSTLDSGSMPGLDAASNPDAGPGPDPDAGVDSSPDAAPDVVVPPPDAALDSSPDVGQLDSSPPDASPVPDAGTDADVGPKFLALCSGTVAYMGVPVADWTYTVTVGADNMAQASATIVHRVADAGTCSGTYAGPQGNTQPIAHVPVPCSTWSWNVSIDSSTKVVYVAATTASGLNLSWTPTCN